MCKTPNLQKEGNEYLNSMLGHQAQRLRDKVDDPTDRVRVEARSERGWIAGVLSG